MEWHFDDNMPIYTQLVYQIKFAIVSGELSPGERMAGVRDLAADAGEEKLLLRSTIIAAVNKMFLDCAFAVMHQEQALWPDILADLA